MLTWIPRDLCWTQKSVNLLHSRERGMWIKVAEVFSGRRPINLVVSYSPSKVPEAGMRKVGRGRGWRLANVGIKHANGTSCVVIVAKCCWRLAPVHTRPRHQRYTSIFPPRTPAPPHPAPRTPRLVHLFRVGNFENPLRIYACSTYAIRLFHHGTI